MQSAVLDAPSPTAANPPGTPTENALRAAHEAMGARALDSAAALCDACNARIEALQSVPGDVDRAWVAQMRAALVAHDQAVVRHHFLSALAAGEPADPIPAPDVSAELVRRTILARGPVAFDRLVSHAVGAAESEADQAAGIGRRLDAIRGECERGGLTLSEFLESYGREVKDRAQHEARARELRQAVVTARLALERNIGAALGNLASLRLGIRESRQLAQRSDAELDALVAERDRLDADLTCLALDGAEPGKIGSELARRKIDVVNQIKARKRVAFGLVTQTGADLADRAQAADPAALVELVAIIKSQPLAFDAGLADRIVSCLADALAASGGVFVTLI
jgi:hypothetical protein